MTQGHYGLHCQKCDYHIWIVSVTQPFTAAELEKIVSGPIWNAGQINRKMRGR